MPSVHPALGAIVYTSVLLAACETTGDPTRGGLFGWSETKAQRRLADREAALDHIDEVCDRERRATSELQQAQKQNRWALASAETSSSAPRRDKITSSQLADLAELAEEADRIQMDSPTPAGASHARRIREAIDRLQEQTDLMPEQRIVGIAAIREEIERTRRQLGLAPR